MINKYEDPNESTQMVPRLLVTLTAHNDPYIAEIARLLQVATTEFDNGIISKPNYAQRVRQLINLNEVTFGDDIRTAEVSKAFQQLYSVLGAHGKFLP